MCKHASRYWWLYVNERSAQQWDWTGIIYAWLYYFTVGQPRAFTFHYYFQSVRRTDFSVRRRTDSETRTRLRHFIVVDRNRNDRKPLAPKRTFRTNTAGDEKRRSRASSSTTTTTRIWKRLTNIVFVFRHFEDSRILSAITIRNVITNYGLENICRTPPSYAVRDT